MDRGGFPEIGQSLMDPREKVIRNYVGMQQNTKITIKIEIQWK